MRSIIAIALLPAAVCLALCGPQDSDSSRTAQTPASEAYDVISLLYPGIIRDVPQMFSFIREQLPALVKRDSNSGTALERDLRAADLIYLYALGLRNDDVPSALLLASLACLTHRTIPLAIGVDVPLTLESDVAHARRYDNLPRRLFVDTPPKGDSDKLQHFFGSAWLALRIDNTGVVHALGLLLEAGEEQLIDERENDERDIRANRLGQAFALALEQNRYVLPSAMFRFWNEHRRIPFD